ncbi:hypothetical protein NRK67_00720 [Fusobacteria bacterium ZRK30]|nr:hypothetical protein NRK67_00720 [Fusobacteria bacterium ZRK30]
MAQRVKEMTNGEIKKINIGYEIFNTSEDYYDKFFIINNKVSIEYNIEDGKLKKYEHLKNNEGKKLKDYIF